jgi:glutamine amidotransferase PdxT
MPVLVQKGPILAACFHPELAEGHWVTREFARGVASTR